jgi:hypothetical protein
MTKPKIVRGKVPLSVGDPRAQDLLWEYAKRLLQIDPDFAQDLEQALLAKGSVQPICPSCGERFGMQCLCDTLCARCAKSVRGE